MKCLDLIQIMSWQILADFASCTIVPVPPQPSQNAAAASRKVKFFQSYPHPCIKCVWHCRGMYVLHLLHRWLALLYICSPQ